MKRLFLVFATIAFFVWGAGCATLQLEDGTHSNRTANGAVIGAAIGVVPGLILRNRGIGLAGALAGGAIGSWVGSQADQRAYENSRVYREKIREEWKETYNRLSQGQGGAYGNSSNSNISPTVTVVLSASNSHYSSYGADWRITALTAIEQGLRQRGFILPIQNNYGYGYQNRYNRNIYAANTDFVAEVVLQDFGSSVKAIVTLRSLKGLNGLDRQGVGQISYNYYNNYNYSRGGRRGPSRDELRDEAATLAAKRAVLNLFTSPYENSLDAAG